MTGYGKVTAEFEGKKIHVEIKSLNSKALDLSTRIAPLYREKEMEIRNLIAGRLERGKVDFNLWVEKDVVDSATPINMAVLESYYKQINSIAETTGIPLPDDWFATLLRLPDVMTKVEVQELSEEEWAVVSQAIHEAIDHLVAFRIQEGAALERKFTEKLDNITALLASIEPYEKARVEKIRARLEELRAEVRRRERRAARHDAHLRPYRQAEAFQRAHHRRGLVGKFHQLRARALFRNLRHRAGHVDLERVEAANRQRDLRALRDVLRARAEELERAGALVVEAVEQLLRLASFIYEAERAHHLRVDEPRAERAVESSERAEGYARERREPYRVIDRDAAYFFRPSGKRERRAARLRIIFQDSSSRKLCAGRRA